MKQKIKSYFLTAHCAACWKSRGFRHIKEVVLIGFCPSLFFIKIRKNVILGGLHFFFLSNLSFPKPQGFPLAQIHAESKLCYYSAIPSDIPALITSVSIITPSILSLLKRKPSRKNAWERHCYHQRHLHNSHMDN